MIMVLIAFVGELGSSALKQIWRDAVLAGLRKDSRTHIPLHTELQQGAKHICELPPQHTIHIRGHP